MNKDKVGLGAISYLIHFFFYLGMPGVYFHLPYGQTERIVQGHVHGKGPSIPDYTTINRRINRLDIKIKDADNKNKEFKDEYLNCNR
jgi:hypothetical protein